MNERSKVLEEAINLINGDREKDYGAPSKNFQTIADMWSAYLGYGVSARDVCNMMALLKIARLKNGQSRDSSLDGAAYLALGFEVGEC